jgi:flavin-dependent dehydrogenase
MHERHLHIVGAGPAGLAAAIVLRRRGFAVTVYDKAPDVGHRLHGDFQGIENWSTEQDLPDVLREIGIDIDFLCIPYHSGAVYAPDRSPVTIASQRPIFYLVKRGSMPGTLDQGLKEQALKAGVELLFNRTMNKVDTPAIMATGAKRADIVAAGINFETGMQDRAVVVFDDRIAPKGYAYLLAHQGQGTLVAVLCREYPNASACLEQMLQFFNERVGVDIRNEKRFGCFGNFFMRNTQVLDDGLYVGEAAGFQDALWGFGIRYALVSGYLAATSIADGTGYDMLWKQELKPMLETSLVNRFLFEKFGHAGYRYLTKRLAQADPCSLLRRHYHASFLKQLLLPVAKRAYECGKKDLPRSREDRGRAARHDQVFAPAGDGGRGAGGIKKAGDRSQEPPYIRASHS